MISFLIRTRGTHQPEVAVQSHPGILLRIVRAAAPRAGATLRRGDGCGWCLQHCSARLPPGNYRSHEGHGAHRVGRSWP